MKETQKQILEKEIQELEDHLRTLSESVDESEKDTKLKELNFNLGQKFAELDEYDKAIEHFENAMSFLNLHPQLESEKAEIYFHLAKSYDRSEQSELAFNTYNQALGFDNEAINGFIHHQLGNWYFSREEWQEALDHYEKAIDYHVDTGKLGELGKNYHMIGAVYANQQINKEALQNFEKSFEWNTQTQNYPELGRSFFNLRIFLQHAMSFNNRKIYYQNLLHESEENQQNGLMAFINHNLGLWFQEDGQYKEACLCLEKSIKLKESKDITFEIGSSYYHAGSGYESLKDHQKSFEYHVTALCKMLDHASYDEMGMVVYFLQTSIHDIKDIKLKNQAIKLIKEAEALGYGVDSGDLELPDVVEEERPEEILTNESFTKTIEEAVEIEQKLEEVIPTESIPQVETEPATEMETEPAIEIESELIEKIKTEPIAEVEQEPMTKIEQNNETLPDFTSKQGIDIDQKAEPESETSTVSIAEPRQQVTKVVNELEKLKERLPDTAEEYGLASLQKVKQLFGAYKDAWFGKKRKKQIFEETRDEILKSFEELTQSTEISVNLQQKFTNWKAEIEKLY